MISRTEEKKDDEEWSKENLGEKRMKYRPQQRKYNLSILRHSVLPINPVKEMSLLHSFHLFSSIGLFPPDHHCLIGAASK